MPVKDKFKCFFFNLTKVWECNTGLRILHLCTATKYTAMSISSAVTLFKSSQWIPLSVCFKKESLKNKKNDNIYLLFAQTLKLSI